MTKKDIAKLEIREKAMKMAQEQYKNSPPEEIVKAAEIFEKHLLSSVGKSLAGESLSIPPRISDQLS